MSQRILQAEGVCKSSAESELGAQHGMLRSSSSKAGLLQMPVECHNHETFLLLSAQLQAPALWIPARSACTHTYVSNIKKRKDNVSSPAVPEWCLRTEKRQNCCRLIKLKRQPTHLLTVAGCKRQDDQWQTQTAQASLHLLFRAFPMFLFPPLHLPLKSCRNVHFLSVSLKLLQGKKITKTRGKNQH